MKLSKHLLEPASQLHSTVNLLDTLSEDALRNVLRWSSARPRHEHWVSFLSAHKLLGLVETAGTLGHVTTKLIKALQVSRGAERVGTVVVDEDLGREAYGKFLEAAAPRLLALDVNRWLEVQSIAACINLKVLTIIGELAIQRAPQLMDAVGSHLDELQLAGTFELKAGAVNAMETSCTQLRRLTITQGVVESNLNGVWRTVGKTLEKLRVVGGMILVEGGGAINGEQLYTCCERLHRVDLVQSLGFKSRASERGWLLELKDRLRELRIMNSSEMLGLEELYRVHSSCPNVMFSLYVEKDITDTLALLGPRLRDVSVGVVENGLDELRDAAAQCIGVEHLHCTETAMPHRFIATLCMPWKRLREVEIDCILSPAHLRAVFYALEMATESIERFTLVSLPRVLGIRGLVRKNRSLKMVSFTTLKEGYEMDMERVVTMIEEMADLSKLEELVIVEPELERRRYKLIAEACWKLPSNVKDVFIGGYSYR